MDIPMSVEVTPPVPYIPTVTVTPPVALPSGVGSGINWNNVISTVGQVATTGLQIYGASQAAQQAAALRNQSPYYMQQPAGYGSTAYPRTLPAGVSPTPQYFPTSYATGGGDMTMPLILGGAALLVIMMLAGKKG